MILRNIVLPPTRANHLYGYITREKVAPNLFKASSNYAGAASGSIEQIENLEYITWIS